MDLSSSGKLLLLVSLLAKDRLISNNSKVFLKELLLKNDLRLNDLLLEFETKSAMDTVFLESIHGLILEESEDLFDELFFDTPLEVGKTLSKTERVSCSFDDEKSLIYGEVDFSSFYRVLRKLSPAPGLIFYDLGSGTGKALFAARVTQDFGKCIGIELLSSLQNQALRINDRFNSQFKDALHKGQSQSVSTVQGSLLGYDWSDGDIVFANSTCFDDSLMSAIAKQAELLLPGSMFVTFTKALPSGCFEIIDKKRYKMSWGPATVFIQRRLADDGTALPAYRLNILPSDDIEYSDLDDQEDEEEDEEEDEVIVKPCLPMSIHKTDKNLSKNIESLPKPPPSRFVLNSPADSALLSRKRSPRAL